MTAENASDVVDSWAMPFMSQPATGDNDTDDMFKLERGTYGSIPRPQLRQHWRRADGTEERAIIEVDVNCALRISAAVASLDRIAKMLTEDHVIQWFEKIAKPFIEAHVRVR